MKPLTKDDVVYGGDGAVLPTFSNVISTEKLLTILNEMREAIGSSSGPTDVADEIINKAIKSAVKELVTGPEGYEWKLVKDTPTEHIEVHVPKVPTTGEGGGKLHDGSCTGKHTDGNCVVAEHTTDEGNCCAGCCKDSFNRVGACFNTHCPCHLSKDWETRFDWIFRKGDKLVPVFLKAFISVEKEASFQEGKKYGQLREFKLGVEQGRKEVVEEVRKWWALTASEENISQLLDRLTY